MPHQDRAERVKNFPQPAGHALVETAGEEAGSSAVKIFSWFSAAKLLVFGVEGCSVAYGVLGAQCCPWFGREQQ